MKALIFTAILSIAALVPPVIAQEQGTDAVAHRAKVLEVFVDEQGEVDFQALAKNPADLKAYV